MNEWMNELTEWLNECMHECMNEWMNDWMNEWMHEWMSEWMNESINQSINQWNLPTSSSKSAPNVTVFLKQFLCEIELSLQAWARFVDNFCKSRPATAETEALLRRPRKPLYPKKRKVSRPRIFSSLNSRVPDLLHFPTTWWWCGWHHDVFEMMVRICPWQSSVTRKFPG